MCATRGGPLWISRSPSVPAWQAMSSLTQGSPEALDSTRARRTPTEALAPIGEVRAKHLNGSAYTVLLSDSRTVTATFTSNPLRVTLASEGGRTGTVTGVGNAISCGTFCTTGFPPNTVATLTAAPAQGAVFTRWSGCTSANGSTARA